jgi:hypothetical protein
MADVMDGTLSATTSAGTAYTRTFLYPDGSDQRAQVMVRNDNVTTDPVYAIIYCHGVGGDESNFNVSRSTGHRNAVMDDGRFIVLQSNADGQNFGNRAGLDHYYAVLAYARRTYNVIGVILYGQSMGGLPSLMMIAEGVITDLVAWVGIAPLCDLERTYNTSVQSPPGDGFTSGMRTAYGFADDGGYAAATAGYDPMLYPATTYNLPMRMWASASDASVTKSYHSDALLTYIDGQAAEAAVTLVTGGHLSSDHFRDDEFMAFLGRALITYSDPDTYEYEGQYKNVGSAIADPSVLTDWSTWFTWRAQPDLSEIEPIGDFSDGVGIRIRERSATQALLENPGGYGGFAGTLAESAWTYAWVVIGTPGESEPYQYKGEYKNVDSTIADPSVLTGWSTWFGWSGQADLSEMEPLNVPSAGVALRLMERDSSTLTESPWGYAWVVLEDGARPGATARRFLLGMIR